MEHCHANLCVGRGEGKIVNPVVPVSYTIAVFVSMGEDEIDEYDGRRLEHAPLLNEIDRGYWSVGMSPR